LPFSEIQKAAPLGLMEIEYRMLTPNFGIILSLKFFKGISFKPDLLGLDKRLNFNEVYNL
jgi:hypothetical protein